MLRNLFCIAALLLALSAVGARAERPTSAAEVQPLLVGAKVPTVAGLVDVDGEAFDLQAALAKKPTVLVFYRGHW